jgi:hypothetical protein
MKRTRTVLIRLLVFNSQIFGVDSDEVYTDVISNDNLFNKKSPLWKRADKIV